MYNLKEWIHFLFDSVREKNNYDVEDKIYSMITQKFNKKNFDMSLIKSVAEKPLLSEANILTKRVLPLTHIYGYIFVTT